jgi:hypothetical protein
MCLKGKLNMTVSKSFISLFLLSFAFLIFFTGCSRSQIPESGTNLITPIFSEDNQKTTPTFTPRITVKAKNTVTTTRIISPTPSFTPMHTLEPAEAQKTLNFLIYQNGGCKLPCWWGITPGQTKYIEMINLYASLGSEIYNTEFGNDLKKNVHSEAVFKIPGQEEWREIEFISSDDKIQWVGVLQDSTGQFTLPNLLLDYGEPGEIYLATEPFSPINEVSFRLILYYPDKGILADFPSSLGGLIIGDYVIICPQKIKPFLHLWQVGDPQQGEMWKVSMMKNSFLVNYKTIEGATGYSTKRFYMTFREKNNMNCLTTKAEKWWEGNETPIPLPLDTVTPTPVNPYLETANPNPNIETVISTP